MRICGTESQYLPRALNRSFCSHLILLGQDFHYPIIPGLTESAFLLEDAQQEANIDLKLGAGVFVQRLNIFGAINPRNQNQVLAFEGLVDWLTRSITFLGC